MDHSKIGGSVGFRVNNLFGDGIKEPLEVIVYEIYDLGNTDVLNTLANTLFKDTEFGCRLQSFCQVVEIGCEEKTIEIFVHKLIREVETKLGKELKSVLWLCDTVQDLVDSYEVQEDSVFSEYEDGFVVLSDLGKQGKLFGYEGEPKWLREVEQ